MTKQEALNLVKAADLLRKDEDCLNYDEIADLLIGVDYQACIEMLDWVPHNNSYEYDDCGPGCYRCKLKKEIEAERPKDAAPAV